MNYKTKYYFLNQSIHYLFKIYAFFYSFKREKRIIYNYIKYNKISLKNTKNRVLIIFDLTSQPFNIGDFILLQEVALILCYEHNFMFSDFAIIQDENSESNLVEFSKINDDNIIFHLNSILSIVQVNPNFGSLFLFNSKKQFNDFFLKNENYYHTWPNRRSWLGNDYNYYLALNDIIFKSYLKNGFIPILKPRFFLIGWVHEFFINNLFGFIPVTVNLRNNKLFGQHRNSNFEVWEKFLKYCENKYKVKFIIIGSMQEIDDRLKALKNVIYSKAYNTTIELDLTLISESAFHIGAPSGPITMAWFSDKPYFMFSWDANLNLYNGIIKESDDLLRFPFARIDQKITTKKESVTLLISQFESMYNKIDKEKYLNYNIDVKNKYFSWLR